MAKPRSRLPTTGGQGVGAIVTGGADAQALLGPPPLVQGEDEGTYAELLARVRAAVAPKDFLEELWVRDVVDLSWEVFRLRRMKANVVTAATHKALAGVLAPIVDKNCDYEIISVLDERPSQRLASGWYRRDEEVVREVEGLLRTAGLSMDVVAAVALTTSLGDIERVDRMVMTAEARRNAVLREVARHRAASAQDLRRSSGVVRDADFTEVPGA